MNWYSLIKIADHRVGVINRIEKHDVELLHQDNDYNCGPATIQNVLRIMGKEIPSEDDLARSMGTSKEKGTAPQSLERQLQDLGIPAIHFLNVETLEQELRKNRIVIVEYQDYQEENPRKIVQLKEASHYAIIIGYDSQFYYLADSYYPKVNGQKRAIKRIDKRKFHKDWIARSFDGKRLVKNYGLVVGV